MGQTEGRCGKWKSVVPGSIGVIQGIGYDGDEWGGSIYVGFCGSKKDGWDLPPMLKE